MKLNIQLFADGKVVIETKLDTSGFEDGLDDLESNSKLSQFIEIMKTKLSAIGDGFKNAFKGAGSGIKNIVKAVASVGSVIAKTMAKAIVSAIGFGVALTASLGIIALLGLAFVAILEAIKKVGEENQTLKNDIQYIIFAIKTSLQPVIDWIAKAIKNIIEIAINGILYIMALVNAIAGKNLFEKATPEAFAKAMKDADKSSKGVAKSAKEIKKQLAGFDEMNILGDTQTGGLGNGSGAKNNYSVDIDIPSNLEEKTQKIKKFFDDITNGFETMNKENTLANRSIILNSDKTWGLMKLGWWDTIQGIIGMLRGIGELLMGPLLTIVGTFIGLFTGDWTLAITGLKTTIQGFKDFFVGIFQSLVGIVELVIGAIWGAFKSLWGWFKNAFPTIASFIEAKFTYIKELIIDPFRVAWQFIKETIKNAKTVFNGLKDVVVGIFTLDFKKALNGFKTTFKGVMDQLWNIVKVPLNLIIGGVNALIKGLNKIKLPDWDILGKAGGKGINIPLIPKLAKGGIINMPGRGTLVGSAIAGESGREAVLPLTDSQQMELLGEAIGKYITINANITNTMNGRIISRELQKISNENSFAGNR